MHFRNLYSMSNLISTSMKNLGLLPLLLAVIALTGCKTQKIAPKATAGLLRRR